MKLKALLRMGVTTALLTFVYGCENNALTPWVTKHNLTGAEYQEEFDNWTRADYRLTYVNCHNFDGTTRYNAIWKKKAGNDWQAFHGQSASEYQTTVDDLEEQGFRPVLVNPCNVNGRVFFTSIFEKDTANWVARHGMNGTEYQNEFDTWTNRGYRLRFVAGYQENGQARYAAIWDDTTSPDWRASHGLTSNEYQTAVDTNKEEGFQPVLVDGFFIGNTPYFTAIWHKKSTRWSARHNVDIYDYQQVFNDHYYEGFEPMTVAGYGTNSGTDMAPLFNNFSWKISDLDYVNSTVDQFRLDNSVQAVTIAITKDERLVYAKAFGMVDTETNEVAHTGHRFRIASNAKVLTGAAISHLIDQGTLDLDDFIFGPGSLLGNQFSMPANQTAADRVRDIQLRHLVEHTAGGWGNANNDPVFNNTYVNQDRDTFIDNVLQDIPLVNDPGDSYAYSNFGYNILEVVIEDATGQTYEQYIRDLLVDPSAANSFAIAGNTLADRLSNEAKYYGGGAYSWNYERMAGHGGWVSTPIDYLRVMTKMDGFNKRADLLSANGINILQTSDENPVDEGGWPYAKGIALAPNRWDHNGRLSGQSSLFQRWDDGYSIMIITNNNAGGNLPGNFYALSTALHDNVTNWPQHNLF